MTKRVIAMESKVWRWFPRGLILSMLVVFAVNIWFVVLAMRSFPGAAGTDGFDLSNSYDHVLFMMAQQDALGWRSAAALDEARRPTIRIRDRDGAPLRDAAVQASAERPLGPTDAVALSFHATEPGNYRAETPLTTGQWDILLTVRAGGQLYTTTQRVRVP